MLNHGAELGREDLHHHAPAELRLLGDEHAAHAAAGELALDAEGVPNAACSRAPRSGVSRSAA